MISDVDECQEEIHSCHPSAECINTDGAFKCSCQHAQSQNPATECKLSKFVSRMIYIFNLYGGK